MASRLRYGSVKIYYDDEVLGVGSYGKVCRARCGQLPCAAKLLHDTLLEGGDPFKRFEQECQFLSMIKHPNIVQYLGTSRDPRSRRLALLMELMDESLTRFLERSTGPLPYHIQLNICHDMALALSYLHSNAIVHRDLSSNNILLIGEGSRAKVTDFGMSKLMDMNPRMTPLTLCPGTTVYMPPEALTTPPHYSSKLDCFSHGVLTIQILTRNFPKPGDAHQSIEDSHYPSGLILIQLLETERRKKDIDLIEPDHPLLPIALRCLHNKATERPSADEVCERLATLKREGRYTHSVEDARDQVTPNMKLQEELIQKDQLIQKERADHTDELHRERAIHVRENGDLENKLAQLQRERSQDRVDHQNELKREKADHQKELKAKDEIIEQILEDCHRRLQEKKEGTTQRLPAKLEVPENQGAAFAELTWRQGKPAPRGFSSGDGTAVAHSNNAYFSSTYDIYSFAVSDNKWTTLPSCQYTYFSMAVINGKLTTIGGWEGKRDSETTVLLSLSPGHSSWKKVLPPMLTSRAKPAAVTTHTHLVVAGGWKNHFKVTTDVVEVLNTETLQWFTASNIPKSTHNAWLTLCSGHFYLHQQNAVYSCSEEELLKSCKPIFANNRRDFLWTRLADIPVQNNASLAAFRENVLAVGGSDDDPTAAIHCYDRATNSWSVIGQLPTPLSSVLTTVLPSNKMIVVGGCYTGGNDVYIGL